jgi:hypothetical protein
MTLKELEWHNPATALRLVDLSDVEFGDDGKIKDQKQLLKAARDLAKENPYLVRSATDVGKETPEGKPSGKPPAGKKTGSNTDDSVRAKYNIHH